MTLLEHLDAAEKVLRDGAQSTASWAAIEHLWALRPAIIKIDKAELMAILWARGSRPV